MIHKKRYKHFLIFLFAFVTVVSVASFAFAETEDERKARLQKELEQIEREIKEQQNILSTKQQEGASISRDIAILNAKIKEAQLKIQKHNLAIERLGKDIVVKTKTIASLDQNIDQGKESLAQIMRRTRELDDFSLPELLLGTESFSESIADAELFLSLENSMKETFTELRDTKRSNEEERENLGEKRNQEIDTRVNVEQEKKTIEKAEAEKKRLLSLNQAEQAGYQKVIADKAKRAAEIRAALFSLRDAAAIPFGDALDFAKKASKSTGVRPALILAILTQESNLGANVGSCYLSNSETGAGIRVTTGVEIANVMKPTRDVAPFLSITKELGRDPYKTRVSCPFTVGYGGAMGPSQFIPSTWMLFKTRIEKISGDSVADPWKPEHAITATSLYMADLGAISGSYTAERNAACKYYSGRPCSGTGNTFYGDQVMAKAQTIQANIDFLDGK